MKENAKELRLASGLPVLTPGLHLVIGRPGSGKTFMITKAVCDWVASNEETDVLLNSLDTGRDMIRRVMADHIGREERYEINGVRRIARYLSGRMIVSERRMQDIAEICVLTRADAVIIDTMYLTEPPLEIVTKWDGAEWPPQTEFKVRALAMLAEKLDIPVIATANLERYSERIVGCTSNAVAFSYAKTVIKLQRNSDGDFVGETVKVSA